MKTTKKPSRVPAANVTSHRSTRTASSIVAEFVSIAVVFVWLRLESNNGSELDAMHIIRTGEEAEVRLIHFVPFISINNRIAIYLHERHIEAEHQISEACTIHSSLLNLISCHIAYLYIIISLKHN